MGAHTCEAELRDGDYYGSGVNRAARLMSVAHGGQIVVSAVTAGLCDDAFPLVDLGEHRLRDLSRAEHVWQVDVDGEHFPQLRSLDNLPGNLPVQLTEFVGRADDVVQVAKALDAHRVVTLTGVGGVGKTRLALQVAAEFADRFRHGTWFCDLAPVAAPEGVVGAIADALGIDAGTVAPDQALVGLAPSSPGAAGGRQLRARARRGGSDRRGARTRDVPSCPCWRRAARGSARPASRS